MVASGWTMMWQMCQVAHLCRSYFNLSLVLNLELDFLPALRVRPLNNEPLRLQQLLGSHIKAGLQLQLHQQCWHLLLGQLLVLGNLLLYHPLHRAHHRVHCIRLIQHHPHLHSESLEGFSHLFIHSQQTHPTA